MKTIVAVALALSLGLNVWMGRALVRLENYHYAVQVGMCGTNEALPIGIEPHMKREDCLNNTQTRTSRLWHLYYALTE